MAAHMQDRDMVSMLLVDHETSIGTVLSILVALLLALIFIAASIMNTLFLVIYWRRPTLRSTSNKFIVSLTVLNLLASWVLLPLVVGDAFLQAWENPLLCTAVDATAEFITSASIFATVMIALDRFYAITKPLHYHMMINRQKSMIMISGSWILALIMAVCGSFDQHKGQSWKVCKGRSDDMGTSIWNYHSFFVIINMILSFVIPMSMIFWMYFAICRAAEKNIVKNRRNSLLGNTADAIIQGKTSKDPSRTPSTRSTSSQLVSNIRHRLSNASLFLYKEESRAAKISIAVVVLFFISWFPYYLTELLESPLIQIVVPHDVHSMVLVMSLSNAAMSPYMYLYRSKRFQREVRRLCGLTSKSNAGNQMHRHPLKYLQREKNSQPSPINDKKMIRDIRETTRNIHLKSKFASVVPVAAFINNIIPVHGFGCEPWRCQQLTLSRSSSTTTVSSANCSSFTASSDTIDYSILEKDESLQPLTQEVSVS